MDGNIGAEKDQLIQLARKADATSIKVGVIHSRIIKLKAYPDEGFTKYTKVLARMHAMLDDIATQANMVHDKLFDIYFDDLKNRYPEVENPVPQRRLIADDGSAIDLTSTRVPRRRKSAQPKPKKEKVVFDFD